MTTESRRVNHPPILDALMLIEFAEGRFSNEAAHALRQIYKTKDEQLSQHMIGDDAPSDDFGLSSLLVS